MAHCELLLKWHRWMTMKNTIRSSAIDCVSVVYSMSGFCTSCPDMWNSAWGQHGAHMGPTEPRWGPCWPHELCYLGSAITANARSHCSNHVAWEFEQAMYVISIGELMATAFMNFDGRSHFCEMLQSVNCVSRVSTTEDGAGVACSSIDVGCI